MKKFPLILLTVFLSAFSVFAQTEIENIIEKANRLNLEQKTAEAITEINRGIAIEPNNPNLYLTRANFYNFSDNKPEILADAQKAASLSPTDRKVLYFSASVLQQSQQLKEALKVADELIALGDVDSFGWSLRINIKMQLQDFVGAFEDTTTALELFPQENMFKQSQAALLRLAGNSDKALEIYNAEIAASERKLNKAKNEYEKPPIIRDLTGFLFSRAGFYLSKSNNEKARADLIKAVNYEPTDFNYYHRAKIYREMELFAEAEADLTKALEILKGFDKVTILIERGDVYVESGKYDDALQDYQEVLKLDSTLKDLFDQRVIWIKQMRGK
jgi:tetratricopeptide (TPR) repeat protein